MNKLTLREALLSMGYTERKPGHWLKPIGFQCFSYHEGKNEWANWFKDATGKLDVWASHSFKISADANYLIQLKNIECYTRCGMSIKCDSEFGMNIPDL
jgi:hypothetical protein